MVVKILKQDFEINFVVLAVASLVFAHSTAHNIS